MYLLGASATEASFSGPGSMFGLGLVCPISGAYFGVLNLRFLALVPSRLGSGRAMLS
jgi:hypothetical protein